MDVPPTLVLAGFYIEELATVRQLLDQVGGEGVKVVPASPALLHAPLRQALAAPEPQWDQPVPPDWQHGGGWGQQRMILIAGLEREGSRLLLDLLEEAEMPAVCPAYATPSNAGAPLGEVLAAALKEWRQGGGGAGGVQQGPAAAAAPAAAAPGVPFVEELPPLEAVVPEEVWQPQRSQPAAAATAAGGGARQAGASSAPEVVQAEFAERPAAPAAGQPGPAAAPAGQEDLPLDVIDAIATGAPPASSAACPAGRAGAGRDAAADDIDDAELESMDSEELLRAARAALGLDSADLQRMVDEAAARAAQQLGVPFEGGDASAASAASAATASAASWSPSPVRGAGGGGSSKPWEAAAAGPAGGTSATGFGRPAGAPPSRKAAKAAAKRQAGRGSQQGAAAPSSAGAAEAAASPGEAPSQQQQQQEQQQQLAQGEEHTVPPFDQFVLSKAQLREVTEKHGLDFDELLAGIQERGINLVD